VAGTNHLTLQCRRKDRAGDRPWRLRPGRLRCLMVAAVAWLAVGAVGRAEIVVYGSPVGHDGWTGAIASPNAAGTDGPVASLERVRDVVRGRRRRAGEGRACRRSLLVAAAARARPRG
jgi:hypothetical protein